MSSTANTPHSGTNTTETHQAYQTWQKDQYTNINQSLIPLLKDDASVGRSRECFQVLFPHYVTGKPINRRR